MDELDNLLSQFETGGPTSLEKPLANAPPTIDIASLDVLMDEIGTTSKPKTKLDLLKERRVSRRVSRNSAISGTAGSALGPSASSSGAAGLEDLDSLMAELESSPNSGGVSATSPSNPTSGDGVLDDIDGLISGLGSDTVAVGGSSRPSGSAPPPSRPVSMHQGGSAGSSGLDDIDALIGGLEISPSPGASAATAGSSSVAMMGGRGRGGVRGRGRGRGLGRGGSSTRPAALSAVKPNDEPGAAAEVDDLDDLISGLTTDITSSTIPDTLPPTGIGMTGSSAAHNQLGDLMNSFQSGGMSSADVSMSKGTCFACRKPIFGQMMQTMGKCFHRECFACGGCGTALAGKKFFQLEGVPHCESCYQAAFCARCAHCEKPIESGCVQALDKKWHVSCFVCSQCFKPFGTSMFFERDGNPFCEACYYGIFSFRCAKCDQPIKGDAINALGKQYHPECFTCTTCNRAFGYTPYFEWEGKPYCETHFHAQRGALCGYCNRPVMGSAITALGKQWHPEHFLCGFCMNPLAGQSFTERDGKAFCGTCHTKLFA